MKSREEGFFYGHPRNRFWPLMAALFGEAVPQSIPEKRALLLRHHIALWDVIARCDITGSADSSIRDAVPVDMGQITQVCRLTRVYCNGALSGRLYGKYLQPSLGLSAQTLPSTSPANAAWSFARLVDAWQPLREAAEGSSSGFSPLISWMKFPASAVTWIDGPKISMQEAGTVKKLLRSCLLLCLCAWLLPCALGEEWNGYPNGYVLCETLTLRESPDVTAPAMTTLAYGEQPTIIEEEEGWYQVVSSIHDPQTGMIVGRMQGWVRAEYLLDSPAFFTPDAETPVYALPATDAKRVALLDANSGPYAIIAEYADYWVISLRGASGFVFKADQ